MESCDKSPGVGKVIAFGILAGIGVALACVGVLKLIGVESNSAMVGGVVGGVTSALVTNMVAHKKQS